MGTGDKPLRHLLIQKITVKGAEVDLSLIKEATYVETIDLSGPRLMLRFNEIDRQMRDDYGLVDDADMAVTIGDQDEAGGISITETFVIKSSDSNGPNDLKVSALVKAVDEIKKPAKETTMLNAKTVQAIVGQVAGGVSESDPFPLVDCFHLNMGEKASVKLTQLAMEIGAKIFYARGGFKIKSLAKLAAQEGAVSFYSEDDLKDTQMLAINVSEKKTIVKDTIERSFVGWEITEGYIGGSGSGPLEITQYHSSGILRNLSGHIEPLIEFTTQGVGSYTPGQMHKIKLSRSKVGKPYDESLPEKGLVTLAAHWYSPGKYQTLLRLGDVKP